MKIVFDVETNGLEYWKSVLSFSAVVIDDDFNVVEEYDRYYFAKEKYDKGAIQVNGLTKDVIAERRRGSKYPKLFKDDVEIAELFRRPEIDLFIAHNIEFDQSFVEYHLGVDINWDKTFCTMLATQYLYKAPYIHNESGEPKWPKLSESVAWAKIDTKEIREQTGRGYHDSLFDVYCTLKIYEHLQKIGENT